MNPINSKVVNSIENVWATAWGDRWENRNIHTRIPSVAIERERSLSYYDAMKLVMRVYDSE